MCNDEWRCRRCCCVCVCYHWSYFRCHARRNYFFEFFVINISSFCCSMFYCIAIPKQIFFHTCFLEVFRWNCISTLLLFGLICRSYCCLYFRDCWSECIPTFI